MDRYEILNDIKNILQSSPKDFPTCAGKEITLETRTDAQGLDFDDLDRFYLSCGLQDKRGIKIPERTSRKFKKIGEWADYIEFYPHDNL